ncbi:MAG TPA: response regulator transcription factor [Ideonella sp.]|nr:response regulator transcription factor [Ideonella sp.]
MTPFASPRLNVLVMHAEPLMAIGLVAALRQQPDFDVFVHGVDVLAGGQPRIDVVIADHPAALQLAAETRAAPPAPLAGAKVMVLTLLDREHDIRVALERGVHGYLLVGCPLDELAEGVRVLGRGSRYLCMAAAQRMADSLTREALTARESEVLGLLAHGQCNKTIARDLEVTVGTVKAHVKAIMGKLGASCRTQALSIAVQRGLVDAALAVPGRIGSPPPLHLPARSSAAALQYA